MNIDKGLKGLIVLVLFSLVVFITIAIFLPYIFQGFIDFFEPGLGLKNASIYGFFVTLTVFILFAIFAGDGLIGEIQFMLGGFMLFWIIFSLKIAWIF